MHFVGLFFSSSILAFRYSFFLFLKCLLASRLTLFRLSTLLWLGSCIHCILACCLWSKKPKHSSSNHALCCCNFYRPRFSLAEVLIFSLIFSQPLFMSSPSLKFSKATNLFVISIWYRFQTSSSFSFLRLNLSTSHFCAASLLSLTFASTVHTSLNFQDEQYLFCDATRTDWTSAVVLSRIAKLKAQCFMNTPNRPQSWPHTNVQGPHIQTITAQYKLLCRMTFFFLRTTLTAFSILYPDCC